MEFLRDTLILRGQSLSTIKDEQHKVSTLSGGATALNAHLLNRVCAGRDAGRIDKVQRDTSQVSNFFYCITCSARNRCHNSTFGTQQGIEQARFTYVGTTNNGCAQALTIQPSLFRACQQSIYLALRFGNQGHKFRRLRGWHILLGEVNTGLNTSYDRENSLAGRLHLG